MQLTVDALGFEYADKVILNAISLEVNPGELLHVRGNNGAGKTTLLRLLLGFMHPTWGCIRYQNVNIWNDMVQYRQNVCYVGHKNGVSPGLTVKEHCQLELQARTSSSLIASYWERFGLTNLEDTLCGLLSVGQQRRLALLRLFVSKAKLWILDEPLVGLDQTAVASLMDGFEAHLQSGGLIIASSHQPFPINDASIRDYSL